MRARAKSIRSRSKPWSERFIFNVAGWYRHLVERDAWQLVDIVGTLERTQCRSVHILALNGCYNLRWQCLRKCHNGIIALACPFILCLSSFFSIPPRCSSGSATPVHPFPAIFGNFHPFTWPNNTRVGSRRRTGAVIWKGNPFFPGKNFPTGGEEKISIIFRRVNVATSNETIGWTSCSKLFDICLVGSRRKVSSNFHWHFTFNS